MIGNTAMFPVVSNGGDRQHHWKHPKPLPVGHFCSVLPMLLITYLKIVDEEKRGQTRRIYAHIRKKAEPTSATVIGNKEYV